MKKTQEDKLVDAILEATGQHWFNPGLVAQMLIQEPIFVQDRLMDLMKEIIKLQASRFPVQWEEGQTSEALMLASHLAEVIEMHEPLPV